MTPSILVKSDGDLTEITLNRPDRLNSFNDEMHLALRAALTEAATNGCCAP